MSWLPETAAGKAEFNSYESPLGTRVLLANVDESLRRAMSAYISSQLGVELIVSSGQLTFTGTDHTAYALQARDFINDRVLPDDPDRFQGYGAVVVPGTSGSSIEEQEPSATLCIAYSTERGGHRLESTIDRDARSLGVDMLRLIGSSEMRAIE